MYQPKPINTEQIEFPEELKELTELLAKNVHEIWAQNRINDGWIYDRNRNDEKKTHPCLVPYEELPEEEKKYDRSTMMETIKVICALGYRIEK